MTRHVLFLCQGNFYRSRFAEHLFDALATERDLRWRAFSRGMRHNPRNVGGLSNDARARLAALGIEAPDPPREPIALATDDWHRADLVVAVKETEQRPFLSERFPEYLERVEWWSIHDHDVEGPELALPKLESAVESLVRRLLQHELA